MSDIDLELNKVFLSKIFETQTPSAARERKSTSRFSREASASARRSFCLESSESESLDPLGHPGPIEPAANIQPEEKFHESVFSSADEIISLWLIFTPQQALSCKFIPIPEFLARTSWTCFPFLQDRLKAGIWRINSAASSQFAL